MQTVSQGWKDNQNDTLVSESDVEISLKLTDPDAYEDSSAVDNGHAYYSDTDYVVLDGLKVIHPYATLERNQWLLDGSREIVPDSDYGSVGFVGNGLCGITREFTTIPTVSINFSQVHLNVLQGITIRWSEFLNEYAEEFVITAYSGNTVVAYKRVTDNQTVLSVIQMDIANYDKITIDIIKWSIPYRRARIDEIFIGILHIYNKKSIFSYSSEQNVDVISAELPKSEVSFSIDNVDSSFNPYNNEGLSKYLVERQEINVKYGYKLDTGYEWISGGKFYLSEWDAKQNGKSADFKARDLLDFMRGTYYKGLYNPSGTSLYDLAEAVLRDADLPLNSDGSVKWKIDERLKNMYTVAPLPVDTHANCLQLIANASESVIYQDRTGVLHIDYVPIKSNLFDKNNLSNFYPDGSGYIWENADIYACIIPVQFGEVYDVSVPYRSNIYAYAYTTEYPVKHTTIYNEQGQAGKGSYYEKQCQITPPNKDCKYLVFSIHWDKENAVYSLEKVANSVYVGRSTFDYGITYFNSYSKSDLSLSKPLKQVDVPCYCYSTSTDIAELYNGSMNIDGTTDVIITYPSSANGVSANVTGGTLNSATYYTNACVLNITATGSVSIKVTGYTMESSSVLITTPSSVSGETILVDNMLITNHDRAIAVGSWVESYMRNRMTLSSSWRADPRLDALDMVDNENDYNTNKVIMTSVKYSYNGAFRGSGEGRVI